jgi:hypothetical protein
LGIYFDPADHYSPPPWSQKKNQHYDSDDYWPNMRIIGGVTYTEILEEGQDNPTLEVASRANTNGRYTTLTDLDKEEIRQSTDSLNMQKAAIIKVKWADGLTNREIAEALTHQYGKGYKLSTVSRYTPCFQRAFDRGVADLHPSPTEASAI